jgi:hypothetical protein
MRSPEQNHKNDRNHIMIHIKQQSAQLLSRRHLASRWAVSKETLKRREKAGKLPFLKLGRDIRYRLSDIEQIEQQAEVAL